MLNDPLSAAEQRCADAERRAEVQYVVSRALGESGTTSSTVAALLPALSDALAWDYAALWLLDDAQLRCAETWTTSDPAVMAFGNASRMSDFPRGRGLPGLCWERGQAVWLSAIQRDPTLRASSWPEPRG